MQHLRWYDIKIIDGVPTISIIQRKTKRPASVKELIDCGINLYIQKEQLILLDEEGHPSLFAPIMIATLSTCAQLERDNISFRLQYREWRKTRTQGRLCKNGRTDESRI